MTNDPLQNRIIPIMAVKEVYNKLLNKIRKPKITLKRSMVISADIFAVLLRYF